MKKVLIIISCLLLFGCSDPFTDHTMDVIKTVKKTSRIKNVQNANQYIQVVMAAYNEYLEYNGGFPTINDLNITYQTEACNTDPNSEDYALKVENGYLHIYCGEYASYKGDTMMMEEQ